MKIQISFDLTDLEKAIKIAQEVAELADNFELGAVLMYKYGVTAIETFKQTFKNKTIVADAKIVDRSTQAVSLFSSAGADWITVMSGTSKSVIHAACTTAHQLGKKIMLDLLDSCSLGQSAMDAKGFGVDALLFHKSYEENNSLEFIDNWDIVRGNTQLPIYVSAKITEDAIEKIRTIKPDGIILGNVVTEADNPAEVVRSYKELF